MKMHVNEFVEIGAQQVLAAYTAETAPSGAVVGRDGNAVLIKLTGGGVAVVSRPSSEGDISLVVPCEGVPEVALDWAF